MHSCPKKTSEAMFDWMATAALKTLINTIISTFTDIQEFSLGCLFLFKKLKFTLLLFETSKGYFSCCLIYCFSSIDISLRYLDVTMSKCFWNSFDRYSSLFGWCGALNIMLIHSILCYNVETIQKIKESF